LKLNFDFLAFRLVFRNTIEGFWSLFNRGIIGIYHNASYKHLNAYCNEFAYRYNTRKITDAQRVEASLTRGEGKGLVQGFNKEVV
jgi:hypothetical protein